MDFLLISLILLGLAVVAALILVVIRMKQKKEGKITEPNYQTFFTIGLSFVALGVVLSTTINPGFLGFTALGIIYMIIGWKNKEKWKKDVKED